MKLILGLILSFAIFSNAFAQSEGLETWDQTFQENHQTCMSATKYDVAASAAEKMIGVMMKINDYLSKSITTDQATALKAEKQYSAKYSACAQVRIKLYGKN